MTLSYKTVIIDTNSSSGKWDPENIKQQLMSRQTHDLTSSLHDEKDSKSS